MSDPNPVRVVAAIVTFLAASAAFLATPSAPKAASTECMAFAGPTCTVVEMCAGGLDCDVSHRYYDLGRALR